MIPEIILASSAGFCFGVKRAVNLLEAEIEKRCSGQTNDKLNIDLKPRIFSLGEIIHNRTFVAGLEKRGVCVIENRDIPEVPKDCHVFIITH